MALRTIREYGDPVLTKKAKPIKEMTPKIEALIKDMLETLYDSGGVGLAAPQVGMLKRLVVIDISEEQNEPHILINPEIIESDGEQKGLEGCLSVPGKSGIVTRPNPGQVRAVAAWRSLMSLKAKSMSTWWKASSMTTTTLSPWKTMRTKRRTWIRKQK